MKQIFRIFIVLSLVVSLFAVNINDTSAVNNDGSTVSLNSQLLEQSMSFRKSMGMESRKERVVDIYESSNKQYKYGVILSEEEERDIEDRLLRQKKIDSILESLKTITDDEVAGVYIDQLSGGIINIGYKSQHTIDKLTNIKSSLPESNYIHFYKAKYSKEEIKKLKSNIRNSKDQLSDQGIEITGLGTSIQKQKVIIYVKNHSAEIVNKLKSMYGSDRIIVEKGAFDTNDSDERYNYEYRAIPGGAGIRIHNGTEYKRCTAGFSATKDSDGTKVLVTAGHCIDDSNRWKVVQGGNYEIVSNKNTGSEFFDSYYDNSTADAGFVENELSKNTTSYILTSYNNPMDLKVGARMLNDYEGLIVTVSTGNSDAYYSTTVIDTDYDSSRSGGIDILEQRVLNSTTPIGGDSGSPVFYWCGLDCGDYVSMYGLHSGSRGSDDKSIVSYIVDIEEALNVSLDTNTTTTITTTIP